MKLARRKKRPIRTAERIGKSCTNWMKEGMEQLAKVGRTTYVVLI